MSNFWGMTLYERFYEVGLLPEWEYAKIRRDRGAMIDLLGRVELAHQASEIADGILSREP